MFHIQFLLCHTYNNNSFLYIQEPFMKILEIIHIGYKIDTDWDIFGFVGQILVGNKYRT